MIDNKQIAGLRRNYTLKELSKQSVHENPIEQFKIWLNEALNSSIIDPNAMTLSTVSPECIPSSRVVLLKGIDERGFIFYTNYTSKKAEDIALNPTVSVNFYWKELERQVNIIGKAEKLTKAESEDYFNSRPLENRLSAISSPQSKPIADRQTLVDIVEQNRKNFEGKEVTLPDFWGGFIIMPVKVEFWQGRENRLHDRICYIYEDGTWTLVRLAP